MSYLMELIKEMTMKAVLILSVFLAAAASDTGAQNREPVAGDSGLRKMFFRTDSAMMNRAALGIELRPTGTRRDTLGVFVAAVTPRGPAETAGIIEGDRIAAINGIDLRSAVSDVDDAYTNGIAAHRLTREVQKLTAGTRVTLRVYSAGRFRDVAVTTGRASEVLRHAGRFNIRVPGPGMEFHGPDGAMMFGPQVPHGIERFGPPRRTRIEAAPRKGELRRAVPARVLAPRPNIVATPTETEFMEIETEVLPDVEVIPSPEHDVIELEMAPIET